MSFKSKLNKLERKAEGKVHLNQKVTILLCPNRFFFFFFQITSNNGMLLSQLNKGLKEYESTFIIEKKTLDCLTK